MWTKQRSLGEATFVQALGAALARPFHQPAFDPSLKQAAVLVLLAATENDLAVTFTKRTSHVEHHKGEVSFPGGAHDLEDRDLIATALRETHEEIGVHPDWVRVLGKLPQAVTRSDFVISPFVGLLTGPNRMTPNPREVAEVFAVPLLWLLDPANKRQESLARQGQSVPTLVYHYRDHRIWGATARILASFLDVVADVAPDGAPKEGVWPPRPAISQQ